MKTNPSKIKYCAIILLLFTVLYSQVTLSQKADTLLSACAPDGAVQFQLIGGLGVYYLGNYGNVCHYRIGADINYNHSDQSGSGTSYSIYSSTPLSSSSGSSNTSQPDRNSTSYQISLSGLYLQQLAQYKYVFLYCGVGPMASYSWNTYADNSTQSFGGSASSSTNNYGSSSKASGIGTLAIIGFESRLLEHVGLSAEIGVSAFYQWTTQSNSTYSTSSSSSGTTNTNEYGNVTHLGGWSVSVSSIRIGLVMEL